MSQKIRLGFVGAGFMGQLAHIANYATIQDCELVALAEGRPETAQAVAQRYGIREVYSNHHQMLEQAEIDGVVAIMGFGLYYTLIPDILAAGKPVATENRSASGRITHENWSVWLKRRVCFIRLVT